MSINIVFSIEFDGVQYSSLEEAEAAIYAESQEESQDWNEIIDQKPKKISKKLYKAIEFYINKTESFIDILTNFQISLDSSPVEIEEKEKLLVSINETISFLDELSYNMMWLETAKGFNELMATINKDLHEFKANMSDLYIEYIIKLANNSIFKIESSIEIAKKPIKTLKILCPKYKTNLEKIDIYNTNIYLIIDEAKLNLKDETYGLAKRDITKAQESVRMVNKGLMKVYEKCGL